MVDNDDVSEALGILNSIRDYVIRDRPKYLHPYTMLTALLTHAPAASAKQEIAKDIVRCRNTEEETLRGLIDLTDYWWTTLLVPSTFFIG